MTSGSFFCMASIHCAMSSFSPMCLAPRTAPNRGCRKRNQNYPVFRAFSVAELVSFRIGFDIQLHPVDISKLHPLEESLSRLHQKLCVCIRTEEDMFRIRVGIYSSFLRLINLVENIPHCIPHVMHFLKSADDLVEVISFEFF